MHEYDERKAFSLKNFKQRKDQRIRGNWIFSWEEGPRKREREKNPISRILDSP